MLSPLTSRAAALTIMFLVVFVGVEYAILPALWSMEVDRQTRTLVYQHEQAQRSAKAALPTIRQELRQLRDSSFINSMVMHGSDTTLLSADLQRRCTDIVAEAGVTLISSSTTSTSQVGIFTRIGLELEVYSSASSLEKLLYLLEGSTPVISVDHLGVDVSPTGPESLGANGQAQFPVHIRLSAYSRPAA